MKTIKVTISKEFEVDLEMGDDQLKALLVDDDMNPAETTTTTGN